MISQLILAAMVLNLPQPDPHCRGRLSFGLEVGGSLSVGELLPIEFKPSPNAEWGIIVPVPLYPGNGLDVGAVVEYRPTDRMGIRAGWGTQIPMQPMAALPSYIKDVTGSFNRFGLDFFGYVREGRICGNVGLGVFFSTAGYEFLFDDFTTQEEEWETITGKTWTAGITPQMGMDLFLTDTFAIGGRLLAPISLVSDDGKDDTVHEGFGNYSGGIQLRLHLMRML